MAGNNENKRKITVSKKSGSKSAVANKKSKKKSETKRPSERLIHKFMPFIWFVLALFLLLCLLPWRLVGALGEGVTIVLCGLFGLGAYLVIGIFVYLGCLWRRLIDRRRVAVKTVLLSLIVLFCSALFEVIYLSSACPDPQTCAYAGVAELFVRGGKMIGGGFIGGSLGWLSYVGLSVVGSTILLAVLVFILALLIIGITPLEVMEWIKLRRALHAERVAVRRELAAKEAEEKKTAQLAEKKDEIDPSELYKEEPLDADPIVTEKEEPLIEIVSQDGTTSSFKLEAVFNENAPEGTLQSAEEDSEPQVFGAPDEDGESVVEPIPEKAEWIAPPIDLLVEDKTSKADLSEAIALTKRKLLETLTSFDIRVKDIGCSVGPTITRYEIFPDSGVRVRAIANLVDDIALNLAAGDIRIEAPIPNKPAVGVEVPNTVRATVRLRSLIDTDTFRNSSPLTVALGQDVGGKNIFFDIKKMPHVIIAGTTGSGKSVCINGIVCSLLYKNSPDKVKLIMIDPKKVEFSIYQHIPHLYCPIISDARKAAGALASAVAEMERRYTLVEDVGVRDVDAYNQATARDPDREYLPKLIIVIDELADLMMMAKADVEQFITRIAQKARAVGIHLIIGTQRPSVDVITGLIKANVPSRIACTVKSQVDSRTILDISGAEKLVGQGDMLFSPIGLAKPMRVQGAFLEDAEVGRIVDFIKANNAPVEYNSAFMDSMEAAAMNVGEKKTGGAALDAADMSEENGDIKFRQAVEIAIQENKISTSLLQRKLEIGYGRAAKIIDRMEELGYVSEADGNKPRRILITKQEFYEKAVNGSVEE